MRITGGEARGRRLSAPRSRDVRPTGDKVRSAIFNILEAREGILGSLILDLFAGSGALGIDALSRGAADVTFVDESRLCLSTVRENLDRSGFINRATVRQGILPGALRHLGGERFDGAFVDPPYRRGLCGESLERLGEVPCLRPEAWVIVEHAQGEDLAASYGYLTAAGNWRYGSTEISLYRMEKT